MSAVCLITSSRDLDSLTHGSLTLAMCITESERTHLITSSKYFMCCMWKGFEKDLELKLTCLLQLVVVSRCAPAVCSSDPRSVR